MDLRSWDVNSEERKLKVFGRESAGWFRRIYDGVEIEWRFASGSIDKICIRYAGEEPADDKPTIRIDGMPKGISMIQLDVFSMNYEVKNAVIHVVDNKRYGLSRRFSAYEEYLGDVHILGSVVMQSDCKHVDTHTLVHSHECRNSWILFTSETSFSLNFMADGENVYYTVADNLFDPHRQLLIIFKDGKRCVEMDKRIRIKYNDSIPCGMDDWQFKIVKARSEIAHDEYKNMFGVDLDVNELEFYLDKETRICEGESGMDLVMKGGLVKWI